MKKAMKTKQKIMAASRTTAWRAATSQRKKCERERKVTARTRQCIINGRPYAPRSTESRRLSKEVAAAMVLAQSAMAKSDTAIAKSDTAIDKSDTAIGKSDIAIDKGNTAMHLADIAIQKSCTAIANNEETRQMVLNLRFPVLGGPLPMVPGSPPDK